MSDNEIDRTLVPLQQSHETVQVTSDTSISTNIASPSIQEKVYNPPNLANPDIVHYVRCSDARGKTSISDGVFDSSQFCYVRHTNLFARHLQYTTIKDESRRVSTSLPLYLSKSDLCTLVPRSGMEYVPLRTPATEPYHYHHVTDQTKSLQELQNEVGALLEFRDLVIETFPDLKSKMASSAANSTLSGIPSSSSSLALRREWEPGIRIRRKVTSKDTGAGSSIGAGGSVGVVGGGDGGAGGSNTTIIPGSNSGCSSSNTSNIGIGNGTGGHHSASGSTPIGANLVGSNGSASNSSSSNSSTTTATDPNHQQAQQQQQQQQQPPQPQQQLQHSHQHHHHHHHHMHTQHGSSSSSSGTHPHHQQQQQHSSSSLIRSRSNSHSGKKEPKSGEGNNCSVIQDSGFSTETSSSKETHSAASSTSGAVQGALVLSTTINRLVVETEDELWNLLDVIHRKGSRLREEVDQHLEREKHRATNLAINHPHHHATHLHPHQQQLHPQQQQTQQQSHVAAATTAVPISTVVDGAQHPLHQLHQHHAARGTGAVVPTASSATNPRSGNSHSSNSSRSSSSTSSSSSSTTTTSSGNNITIHHSNPASSAPAVVIGSAVASSVVAAPPPATTTVIVSATPTSAVIPVGAAAAAGSGGTLAKSFQSQQLLLRTNGNEQQQPIAGGGSDVAVVLTGSKDHNVQILRNERDRLLDKLSEYEAEKFAGRIREAKMHDELETLTLTLRDLQEQLKAAHSQKRELNSKLNDLHLQTVNRSAPSSPESIKLRQQSAAAKPSTGNAQPTLPKPSRYHHPPHGKATVAPPPLPPLDEPGFAEMVPEHLTTPADLPTGEAKPTGSLGRLDALLGAPRLQKVRSLDSKKIAAILLETNIVELQRHLLTMTVQNQVLQQRLEQATRSRLFLSEKFEKSKEDLDDLRFQLLEKSIELEGTKAQLRVIESKSTLGKLAPVSADTSPEHTAGRPMGLQAYQHGNTLVHHHLHHHHNQQHQGVSSVAMNSHLAMRLPSSQVSTPSMKAMTPVAMDDMIAQQQQLNSSTESAQEQAERDSIGRLQQQQLQNHAPETPRRRPSKIPLGTKGSAAPKPPSGRNFSATPTPTTPTGPSAMPRTLGYSGPSSNRSLTKSTGSLYVKSSDVNSFSTQHQHHVAAGSSWRNSSSSSSNSTSKDTPSFEKSRSSSIPISAPKGQATSPPQMERLGTAGTRGTATMMTLPPPPIPPTTSYSGIVSSSPLPRSKRDTLTTKVKNCDSLSRKQSLRKDAPNPSIGSGQSYSSSGGAGGPPAVRERKSSAGGVLRNASNTSLGSGGHADVTSSTIAISQMQQATATVNSSGSGSVTTSDNGKTRKFAPGNFSKKHPRSNTFRLTKSTLMSPELVAEPPGPSIVPSSLLPGIVPFIATSEACLQGNGGFLFPNLTPSTNSNSYKNSNSASTSRKRSQTSTDGSVAVKQPVESGVRPAFSTPSVLSASNEQNHLLKAKWIVGSIPEGKKKEEVRNEGSAGDKIARNLIGEYLAAKKNRCTVRQQQQQQIPPPIFRIHQNPPPGCIHHTGQAEEQQHNQRQIDELAYKHPILLMNDKEEEDQYADEAPEPSCLAVSGDECFMELILQEHGSNGKSAPCKNENEENGTSNESLIIPMPKMIAFHSLKGGKEAQQQKSHQQQCPSSATPTSSFACRLVGKVNPNILKMWEGLSGNLDNACLHSQTRMPGSTANILLLAEECVADGEIAPVDSMRADTSSVCYSAGGSRFIDTNTLGNASGESDSADERQSCLLYCPHQRPYHHCLEENEKGEEEEVVEFKVNKLQHPVGASTANTRTISFGTSSSATNTAAGITSSDGGDFYDSIDAISTCVRESSLLKRPAELRPSPGHSMAITNDGNDACSYTDMPRDAGGEALAWTNLSLSNESGCFDPSKSMTIEGRQS